MTAARPFGCTRLVLAASGLLVAVLSLLAGVAMAAAPETWQVRYTVRQPATWAVYVADVERGINLRMLREALIRELPVVAPDAGQVAWVRSGRLTLWQPGDSVTGVEREIGPGTHLAWSPDGTRIAYHEDGMLRMLRVAPAADPPADPRTVFSFRFNEYGLEAEVLPVWSPNGDALALQLIYRNAQRDIRVAEAMVMTGEGLGMRRLHERRFTMAQDLAWSPDSSQIALSMLEDGRRGIYIADARGRTVRLLLRHPFPIQALTWSPDGAYLAFTAETGGQRSIYLVDVATGELRGPLEARYGLETRGRLIWSPEGRHLAFATTPRRGVYVIDIDGGLPRLLARPDGYTELLP